MLNERQKKIVSVLESTRVPIPSKELCDRFHVSLRTIRNDINEIQKFTDEKGAELKRLPGVGIQIVSKDVLSESLKSSLLNQDFVDMNDQQRQNALVICFLMRENPLTIEMLEEIFCVSKNTLLSSIRNANAVLAEYGVNLKGVKHQGYYLTGSDSDIFEYFAKTSRRDTMEQFSLLYDPENRQSSKHFRKQVDELIRYAGTQLSLMVMDYHRMAVLMAVLIRISPAQKTNRRSSANATVEAVSEKIRQLFGKEPDEQLLKETLIFCTDFNEQQGFEGDESKIEGAVDCLIAAVKARPEYEITDADILKSDLIKHLKTSVNNQKSGHFDENPLLDEIRNVYGKEFEMIHQEVNELKDQFPIQVNDDEIGFLTLYFCRSFEKTKKIGGTRLMVVCNTGRSASKLLATRLINNLPNIHIVAMSSLFDVETNPSLTDNVDLIVTTIPLNNARKPYVLVSPFLQKVELDSVIEAIWAQSNEHLIADHQDMSYRLLSQTDIGIDQEAAEYYADFAMDIFSLIQQLYPGGLNKNNYDNAAGIFAHLMMSVPRWKRNEYIKASDYMDLCNQYEKQYRIILDWLGKMEKKLKVSISRIEAIAVLRYYNF